jgi:acyl-CoA synthetase (AMP-forming)/AMP-acid ligase II
VDRSVELTAEALMSHGRQNLSPYKVPTVVLILSENDLPMPPTGKVDRAALVAMLAESTSGRK